MKAVGATAPDQFDSKLVELLQANASLASKITSAEAAAKAATDALAGVTEKLTAAEKTIGEQALAISGLTAEFGKPHALTAANITKLATEAGTTAGSKTAMEAVSGIGAGAPPAPGSHAAPPAKPAVAATFPDLVAAQCAKGLTKIDAISAVVKSNPAEHQEWLKAGGASL